MFLKRSNIWIIFLFLMIVSACGYKFTGGGSFPAGIKSICVVTLENRTSETGAENIFTNDLIYEVTRDNKAVLTTKDKADALLSGIIQSMNIETISRKAAYSSLSKDKADALLSGIIQSMNIETISRKAAYSSLSLERRVTITVDVKLTNPDGRVVWSAKDVSANEAYDVMPDKLATELKRRDAISALSKRLAQKLYARITDNF